MKKLIFKCVGFSTIVLSLSLLVTLSLPTSSEAQTGSPTPTPTTLLTVSKVGIGTVTSNDGFINCGATCSRSYTSASTVTLTATPSAGYNFSGWSGSCTGTGSCVVTMSANRSVTATFTAATPSPSATPSPQILTVFKTGSGTVTSVDGFISCGATCSRTYSGSETVTLNASPSAGYNFSGWSGDCSGVASCVVNMTANRDVIANFTTAPTPSPSSTGSPRVLTITKSGSGTVTSSDGNINCGSTCSYTYYSSVNVNLTATPAAGYTFTGWSGPGCNGTGACSASMSTSRSYTATFAMTPVNALVKGWGWSPNIGWISFNSVDAGAGGGPYEVNIVNNDLIGYAWSSNIGWIKFGGLSGFPAGGSSDGNAHVSATNLLGWARACAGTATGDCSTMNSRTDGWDGWIELSGVNHTLSYKDPSTLNNTAALFNVGSGNITGFAWGADVVGWIELNLTSIPVAPNADLVSTISITGSNNFIVGSTYTLNGTVRNRGTDPTAAGFSNVYQICTSNCGNSGSGWSDLVTAGSMSALNAGATQNTSPASNRPVGSAGTYYFRTCANRGGTPVAESDTTDASNCSAPATMIVTAGGGGGNPSSSPTPSPSSEARVVTIRIHDTRYGYSVISISTNSAQQADPPVAKVRKGQPFNLIGTESGFATDQCDVSSTETGTMSDTDRNSVLTAAGKPHTQAANLATYQIQCATTDDPPQQATASIKVKLIDPSIEEI
jgi:hypothetical protein